MQLKTWRPLNIDDHWSSIFMRRKAINEHHSVATNTYPITVRMDTHELLNLNNYDDKPAIFTDYNCLWEYIRLEGMGNKTSTRNIEWRLS